MLSFFKLIVTFHISVVALIAFLIMRYFKKPDPEKYILDPDDDDIRENVMNYNEEGAGNTCRGL